MGSPLPLAEAFGAIECMLRYTCRTIFNIVGVEVRGPACPDEKAVSLDCTGDEVDTGYGQALPHPCSVRHGTETLAKTCYSIPPHALASR